MIDININAIISQALAAAVQQATAPLLERIATMQTRLLALENNPAQGVDTTLEQRIAALETKLTEADLFTKTTEVHVNKDELLEHLDNQEWFWGKIRNFTDTAVEQAIEEHNDYWDHSAFMREDKLDDYVRNDNFRDEIEDVLNNATIRLRF